MCKHLCAMRGKPQLGDSLSRATFGLGTILLILAGGNAAALNIVPDYSAIGTVRVDAIGNIVGSGGMDVTTDFIRNINAAIGYWESAITKDWTVTVSFSIADLGTGTVGDSNATNRLATAPRHITAADIRFNNNSAIKYFIDSTPGEDSEFNITTGTATLGGDLVNVDRRGSATVAGGAAGRWDLLTLSLHELEHSIGFDRDEPIYLAALETTPNRHITIDDAMSGLSSDFDIRITDPSAHIDVDAQPSLVDTVVAKGTGEWGSGERAKLTGADILAVCQINQCGNTEFNLNPTTIPEPGAILLVAMGIMCNCWLRPRRARRTM